MIHKESFGTLPNGKNADLFTLKNSSGMAVTLTNYGAAIVSIITPDRHGHWADVALGYDNLNGYVLGAAYFGGVVGRYANRIAGGSFQLNGKTYHVTVNDGSNCLHGGKIGFNKVLWSAKILKSSPEASITMTYISPDGEEGFPGTVIVSVTYTLTEDNQIRMDFSGTSDRTTILNLCNHSYFNLTGDPTKSILDHELTIHAERYTPVDRYLIPTGELAVVANTPFDFRKKTRVGKHIDDDHDQIKKCKGYDLNWVLDSYTGSDSKIGNRQRGCLHLCQAEPTQHKPIFESRAVYTKEVRKTAELQDPFSGRTMEVWTDQPGMQFYSGNFLNGMEIGKHGIKYQYRTGLALETQLYPDSPNHSHFPSAILKPGQTYKQTTIYRFYT